MSTESKRGTAPQYLSFRVPAVTKDRLAQVCRRRSAQDRRARVSVSSLVRFYIERGLQSEPKERAS
jgi:hypothetical protein